MDFKPNELFNQMALFYTKNKLATNPENGRRALVKIANQGSSRSGKTYAAIQFIYTFCLHNANKGLYIAVLRETLVDCRKYTYKDFIECFKSMGVIDNCTITEYPNPKIKLYGNTIEFMGLPEPNKQPPRTDICFFNEIVEVNDKQRVNGLLMRCEKLAIFDWNPSYTDHWIFGMEQEFNTLFTRTSYLDNAHLTDNIISNIESYCPWDFKDSKVEKVGGLNVRYWKKPERPDNCSPADYSKYRADNRVNVESGTANKWYWLVYGEGVPAAKEGAIFDPIWISEFPPTGLDHVNFSLDFGYTCFSGDTLITTSKGEVPIKDVRAGDFVLTSGGYNKVLKHNRNGVRKVIEKNIRFDFGYRKVSSTFDHKFKTDKGWKQFKDLQKKDKLNLLASSTGQSITATHTENIQATSSEGQTRKGFMYKYGKRPMAKYPQASTYTTLTETRSTMTSRILQLLRHHNTLRYTNTSREISARGASRKRIGLIEGLRLMLNYRLLKESVNPVDRRTLRQILIRSTAPINVITNTNTLLKNLMRTTSVLGAEALSEGINTSNRKPAPEHVTQLWCGILEIENLAEYETEVFDLTVENVHEYFANGMLVHNCDPSVLVKSGVNVGNKELYAECMTYSNTPDVDSLFELISPHIRAEVHRRKIDAGWWYDDKGIEHEGVDYAPIVVACDSADKYKDFQFVRDLNAISMQRGLMWQFVKVKKPSITTRLSIMQRFTMYVVKSEHTTKEAQNYVYMVVEGRQTNIPIDNFNHFWDSLGYGVIYFYKWLINL